MSVMARIQLVWETDDKTLPTSVVVKIPSLIQFERMQAQADMCPDEKARSEMQAFLDFGRKLGDKVYAVSNLHGYNLGNGVDRFTNARRHSMRTLRHCRIFRWIW
jgi:hypothetical protein